MDTNDGTIIMRKMAGRGSHVLQVGVSDIVHGTSTTSTVDVNVVHIEETTLRSSGSFRVEGKFSYLI